MFRKKRVIIIIIAGIDICIDHACWRQEAPDRVGQEDPGTFCPT